MSDLSRPKLADAMKGHDTAPKDDHPAHPHRNFEPADVKQENAQVNQGIKDQDQRLVNLGRADQTTGR